MAAVTVMDDKNIKRMLRNEAIVVEFPFVKAAAERLKNSVPKKGGCCGRRSPVEKANYDGLRRAIASLPGPKQSRLKTLLNTDKIRVYYKDGQKKQKLTF
jgi:hypothetical protein